MHLGSSPSVTSSHTLSGYHVRILATELPFSLPLLNDFMHEEAKVLRLETVPGLSNTVLLSSG